MIYVPAIEKTVRQVTGVRPESLPLEVLRSDEPLLLKGLVSEWPMVRAAMDSMESVDRYLRRFSHNQTVGAFIGDPQAGGRVFYDDDLTGFNYQPVIMKFNTVLDKLRHHITDPQPPSFYVGSTTVDDCLPGFRHENDLGFGSIDPLVSIWMGNRTRVAAHFDVPDNVACCAAGRRRFTLFPPDQVGNLYVGPLDFTPAGQAISMVDFESPDFEKFPKFREALKQAFVVEMEPGDALFVPSMWWHHVEALDGFNVLINYWWRQSPAFMDSPANVLEHAILSLRDLPPVQRKAWQDMFNYYVFEFDEQEVAHIPGDRRGVLAPLTEMTARKLRAKLLRNLNR